MGYRQAAARHRLLTTALRAGAGLDGVLYLRRVADSDQIKAAFKGASRVAVIGGGWIGLETASAARAAGVEVTVLETAELPLLRVLGRQVAQVFADLHREHDVDLRCGVQITEITGNGRKATGVRLADGSPHPGHELTSTARENAPNGGAVRLDHPCRSFRRHARVSGAGWSPCAYAIASRGCARRTAR